MTSIMIKLQEVVYRADLYPRFEPNHAMINRYSDSIEYLPPIKINQDNILVDGFHRWKAHQLAGMEHIRAEVITTSSENELKRLAYHLNSNHGLSLSTDEKRAYAQQMIGDMSVKEISDTLCVNERTVRMWTENQREALTEERNRKIIDMYLQGWNTQANISDLFGLSQKAVSDIINRSFGKYAETTKDFQPFLGNIWNDPNTQNTSNGSDVFPLVFMENVLYYFTEPKDIIFDPFPGSGTTIDACKKMFRRYICTDLNPHPGRETDIKKHDITVGLPDIPKPDMVFLNFTLLDKGNFYNIMPSLFDSLKKWKIDKIVVVAAPYITRGPGYVFEDTTFEVWKRLSDTYSGQMRVHIPYHESRYNKHDIEEAKKNKYCLSLLREILFFSRRGHEP